MTLNHALSMTCRRFLGGMLFCLALLGFTALPAHAQNSGAGTISGTILDASQAVVAGATVTVTNTDTGVVHTYTTNTDGLYSAPFLLPGHYRVSASGTGFGKVEANNLTLLVGQTLTINLTLTVQSAASTVEVTSETPLLDPEKTEVSQVLDQQLVQNLPVPTRNWSSFVLLTPNVTQDGGSGLVSFHGISGLYNQNYVDGANNNQMLFSEARGRASGAPYVYSLDSIKEFQTETSNYSVEFGQAAGGQVNAITKSGTNTLHGDLFWALRYPDLNALDPYSKYQALYNHATPFLLTQPIHQQNQFGGSVGGPIIKDRLFYFFTYDGFRRVGRVLYSDSNTITTTSTASNAGGTVISPTQCPTTITNTQCLAGINFLLSVANVGPGDEPPSRFAKENLFFPRLDYHINSKNDAFADFNFANFDSTYGYSPANTFTNSSPSTNGPTSYHERFLVGGLTTVVSDTAVNQVHLQWGRDLETAGENAPGPSIATGVVTYGMPNALPRIAEPDEHRIQATDVFSKVHGRHNFKFGGDANIVHEVMINLYQGGGLYSYSESTPAAAFADWIADAFQGQSGDTDPYAGFHYSSFVQTVDVVNTKAGTQGKDDFWMKMFDGFAEDSWKLRPNFTLTAGVRYDVQLTPPPGLINNNYAPISTYYSQTIKNVLDRVQPRVGFSWSPYKSGNTIVRGGYGLFSALNQGSTYYAMRVENGVVQINYNYTGCRASVGTPTSTCPTVPTTDTSLQYPNVPFLPTGPSLSGSLHPDGGAESAINGPSKLGPQSFHGLDPNFVPPYAHEANLSIEQALPGKLSLTVGYVGTRGMRLPVFVDANLIGQTPSGLRSYNVLDASGNFVKQLTVPVYRPTDRRNTSLATYNTGFSVANTWYNSMAVTMRRPFANGLEVLANYTWAKATDTGQVQGNNGTFYGGDTPLDPNNIRGENGPSDIDIRNRFTLALSWQPHIMMDNKIVRTLLDDFTFSGDEVASGGEPIFLGMSGTVYSGSTSSTSYGADGGIYGGAISSGSGGPTTGRPPQIGRNSITGPGFNSADFRIARDFRIGDKYHFQIVGDAFNVANHLIITSVNTTYSAYTTASGSSATCNSGGSAPTGSVVQGCISPYAGTGLSAFGHMSGTSNGLYGPRQLQVSAKFTF
ncbi:MAG TPA: TonB-dependent receptor [Terracidiphilus sp.]|nr:TonB-dependent receptor [Terracidiphilus sp.]